MERKVERKQKSKKRKEEWKYEMFQMVLWSSAVQFAALVDFICNLAYFICSLHFLILLRSHCFIHFHMPHRLFAWSRYQLFLRFSSYHIFPLLHSRYALFYLKSCLSHLSSSLSIALTSASRGVYWFRLSYPKSALHSYETGFSNSPEVWGVLSLLFSPLLSTLHSYFPLSSSILISSDLSCSNSITLSESSNK